MSVNIKGIKVGTTNITSGYTDSINQSDTKEFTVTVVSLGSMSSINDNFVYNKSEIKPHPLVYAVVNGINTELQEGIDYDLTYANNINAGNATVTATGKGNYTGTVSQNFTINPKIVVLQWGQTSWTYDGVEHTVTCEVNNLESGDSCTVTLSNNKRTNIGTQTVTATALSNSNYTLTGASHTTETLSILAGMFVKISGVWKPVKRVYKKVSGQGWVLQSGFSDIFDTSKMYIKKN